MALIDADMKKEASDMLQSLMKDGFNTSLDLTFVDSISQKLENVFPNPTCQVKLWLKYVRMLNWLVIGKDIFVFFAKWFLCLLPLGIIIILDQWDGFSKICWNYQLHIPPYIACLWKDFL